MLRFISLLWLLFLATLVGGMGSALAHATLIATVPTDGAVLDVSPRVVQLRFNEPVSPLAVHLIDANGQTRQGGNSLGAE
jgi:copper transport protein